MAEQLTGEELLARSTKLIESEDMTEVVEGRRIAEFLLDRDTENPGLLFFVATGYMREKRYGLAEQMYRRCLTMAHDKEVDFPEAWNNLGYVLQYQGRKEQARECFMKALSLKDTDAAFYNNIATLYVNEGTPHEAIEWCEKALALDPECEDALWNRGLAQLELGNWAEGWGAYRHGATMKGIHKRKMRDYHKDGTPYWDGTPGQTVVVFGEQGVGDEIMGASMLHEAAERANIIYDAHPRLVNIMRASFPDFPVYGTRKQESIGWPAWHDIDAKIPILGLGELFRQRDEDFPRLPYLVRDEVAVEHYCSRLSGLGTKPKIGLSWKGGSLITRFDLRSIPLPLWVPLLESVDVDWISLQYDPADDQGHNTPVVQSFNDAHELGLHHWPEVVNDLDECYAGLIHALDLVITVNTSLVHACGAFGVPCWVLTPTGCAWRYNVPGAVSVGDDRMIWYGDHVRQFRQAKDEPWQSVIERVLVELQAWAAAREAA